MSRINLESMNLGKVDRSTVLEILESIDTVITDCDGVLWTYETPIPGSVDVINKFKSLGRKVYLLTNLSIKSRYDICFKAKKMGYEVIKEDIITTAYLVALHLTNMKFKKKVYVIGSRGITDELQHAKIRYTGFGPDVLQHSLAQTIESFRPDPEVGAVVVGFDEHFCYTKLMKAASYLNKPSCHFLATNYEVSFPIHSSLVIPATGSIVKAVESVAHRKALLLGKPNPFLGEVLLEQFNINPPKTLLIGDRCNTDMVLGTSCGFQTLLVLSGAPTYLSEGTNIAYRRLESFNEIPDYYVKTLGDLLPFLEEL